MKNLSLFLLLAIIIFSGCSEKDDSLPDTSSMIIDHNCTKLSSIPVEWVTKARQTLHIAYGHTSHGSQLTDGMTGL